MRNSFLASCAIAAIVLGGGFARAQTPQTQSQTQATPQATEHSRGAEGTQRQAEPTGTPGRAAEERTNAGQRQGTERRAEERSEQQDRFNEQRGRGEGRAEQRSERQEQSNEERGRRGEGRAEQRSERQERFNEERGRRGEGRAEQRSERRERFSDEQGRRGEQGFREERRLRTERDVDRDRDQRFQDRRYGDQYQERGFEDRRYGARAERYEGGQGQLHISRRQRARVHDILVRRRTETENVDFPVRVGARIPNYVTSYRLPDDVYDYLPGYEGYRYFVTGDEVVIVDPDTMEVVAVLED